MIRKLSTTANKVALLFMVVTFLSYGYPTKILAQSKECSEARLKDLGVALLDCGGNTNCSVDNLSGSPKAAPNGAGGFSNNEVLAFMNSPISSNWGVLDTTAEQWFLKQAGARATISRYKINSGNIAEITSAVKAVGISPVFFYAYTVNEGGGAGGFINHYKRGNEAPGGGVGNAARDAKYLLDTSGSSSFGPSWVDAGNKVNFVPQDVINAGNLDFKNMPLNTIGRVYIPASAAATWEVYYPNGLKKEFNKVQNYGHPLSDMIDNIKKLGGDPSGDLSTIEGCSSNGAGLTGEGIVKAVSWAKMIANNDGYGYDQTSRTSGWEKWQSDPNCTDQCGSFDCSSFIAAAFTVAGYFDKNPQFATANMVSVLKGKGFTEVNGSATSEILKPGDILVRTGHTAMYIGDGQIAHASINENGGATGGKTGDQTGKEIKISKLGSDSWNLGIWRAPN